MSLPLISQQSGKFIHHSKGSSKNLFCLGLAILLPSTLLLPSLSQSSSLPSLQLMTMNQIETKKIILNFMSSFFVQAKIKTEPQMSMQFVVFSLSRQSRSTGFNGQRCEINSTLKFLHYNCVATTGFKGQRCEINSTLKFLHYNCVA